MMDVAKVSVQHQITIPKDVRLYLMIEAGDKVVFSLNEDTGDIIFRRAK